MCCICVDGFYGMLEECLRFGLCEGLVLTGVLESGAELKGLGLAD